MLRRAVKRAIKPVLIMTGVVAGATLIGRRLGYNFGTNTVVRCRQGHLFTTVWIPGVKLKELDLIAASGIHSPEAVRRAHWRPREGYGVAAKPSGLVILDVDIWKPDYELPPEWRSETGISDGADVLAVLAERAGQDWPTTFTVRTPSGGQHLYLDRKS